MLLPRALRDHDDESGQVLVLAAQAVAEPTRPWLGRPGCWLPVWKNVMAGSWLIASVCMRLDEGDVVDDLGGVRQQFADPGAGLAVLLENLNMDAAHGKVALAGGHAGDALAHADGARAGRCPGSLGECGLVVEEIDLGGAAGLVEEDDALGLGREVGSPQRRGHRALAVHSAAGECR